MEFLRKVLILLSLIVNFIPVFADSITKLNNRMSLSLDNERKLLVENNYLVNFLWGLNLATGEEKACNGV